MHRGPLSIASLRAVYRNAASRTVKGAVMGAAEVGGDVSVVARRSSRRGHRSGRGIGVNVEEWHGWR